MLRAPHGPVATDGHRADPGTGVDLDHLAAAGLAAATPGLEPILTLAAKTQTVSEHADYSPRMTPPDDDGELGVLYRGFNAMLARIERRDAELTDIRERLEQRVEERARDLNAVAREQRLIVEALPLGIIHLVEGRRIARANPRAAELFGMPLAEMSGRGTAEFYPGTAPRCWRSWPACSRRWHGTSASGLRSPTRAGCCRSCAATASGCIRCSPGHDSGLVQRLQLDRRVGLQPLRCAAAVRQAQFRSWWCETATPTFLVDVLTERQTYLPRLEHLIASEQLLSAFDVERIATEALLFQTGYLTIDSVRQLGAFVQYRLRYPNLEVRASLNAALLDRLGAGSSDIPMHTGQLYTLLQANDFAGLERLFTAFYASIPTDWYRNNPIARYEGYYASVFYAYFASLGLDLTPEETSNAGRLDMALRFNGQVYLFEFKVVELAPEGRALQQIKDRGYADKYRGEAVPVYLIGVEFSRERRTLVGFEVERLGGELA